MSQPTLAQLVQANPCAHALILAYARNYPNDRYSDADHAERLLQAEGQAFGRSAITDSFRDMERCRLGKRFAADTRNPGFHWAVLPLATLEGLRTGTSPLSGGHPAPDIQAPDAFEDAAHSLPVHRFRLRPDCTVRLDLPDNLTQAEVKRLTAFLSSLVCSSGWPYSSYGDDVVDDMEDNPEDELEDDQDDVLDGQEVAAFLNGSEIIDDLAASDSHQTPAPQPQPDKS